MIQEDEPNCSKPQFKSYSSGRKTKISQQQHKSLKNECLSKRGLDRSQAPGPTKENGYTKKKKKKKRVDIRQTEMSPGIQAPGGRDDEE